MSETGKLEEEAASLKQVSSLLACAIPTAYVNLLFEVRNVGKSRLLSKL